MNPAHLLAHFHRIGEAPDAIPCLRQFILELAFGGKLVPQRQVEGTGEELLKAIQRAHPSDRKFGGRAKEGKTTLDPLNCPGIAEAPCTWRWSYLDFICEQISDVDHKMPKAVNDGVPFISARDLKDDGTIDILNAKRISEDDYLRLSRKVQMRRGDIVYSRIGTIGKARLVTSDIRFIISYSCCLVRPLKGHLDVRYVQLFLESRMALTQAHKSTQGIGVPDLGIGEIKQFKIPLPPLDEQHRIVAKVDELMALCDRLEAAQMERESRRDRLVASTLHHLTNGADPDAFREHARFYFNNLPRLTTRRDHIKQLRQTIRNLAVRGKLVPQDPTDEPASELLKRISAWRIASIAEKKVRMPRKPLTTIEESEAPYQLPTGWIWSRLGELIYIHSGDGLSADAMRDGSVPVYGGNGVTGFHDNPNIHKPTIVIGRVGYYCGSVHVTPAQAWVTDNAFITEFSQDGIFQDFLVLLLGATDLKENEKATAQPVISGSKIYPIVVGLPPLAEQHRIVAKVDELMALCDQLETQLTTTHAESHRLLQALLHNALNSAIP